MPGAASFAAKYPQGGWGNPMSGKPWMANSLGGGNVDPSTGNVRVFQGGGGPTLSSNGGVGSYNPTGQRSDLASVLAGSASPTMVGTGGMQMGGGFQKPGGKPSIGTAGGGGKPSFGMAGPSRAQWK